MFKTILQTIWLLLPAGVANMAPVLFKWLPVLNTPIDFGRSIHGQRIFGQNKTWRGLLIGILAGIVVVYLQQKFYPGYGTENFILLGALLGGGALLGDLVKSFFKRRVAIAPGQSWWFFDQIDWIVGALVLVSFYKSVSWQIWLTALVIFGLLHPVINLVGYYLGIKQNKF